MEQHPIKIDATKLVYPFFKIPGQQNVEGKDASSCRTVQTYLLKPGEYHFQVTQVGSADFTCQVTDNGTVEFVDKYSAFLNGKGSSTLVITGFPVTLDARYLSGDGAIFPVFLDNTDWISHKECSMVPGTYQVQQGSGIVASFDFRLMLDGKFCYDQSFDIHNNDEVGFLAGKDTTTLEFLGYPVLVDARAAGEAGLCIAPPHNMPFTKTSVQFANLLPASFRLQVNSGVLTNAVFSLDTKGNILINSPLAPYLEVKRFNRLPLLKVLKSPLP